MGNIYKSSILAAAVVAGGAAVSALASENDNLECVGGEFAKALINAIEVRPAAPEAQEGHNGAISVHVTGFTKSGRGIWLSASLTAAPEGNLIDTGAAVTFPGRRWVWEASYGAKMETKFPKRTESVTPNQSGEGQALAEAREAFEKFKRAIVAAPGRCGLG